MQEFIIRVPLRYSTRGVREQREQDGTAELPARARRFSLCEVPVYSLRREN